MENSSRRELQRYYSGSCDYQVGGSSSNTPRERRIYAYEPPIKTSKVEENTECEKVDLDDLIGEDAGKSRGTMMK